MAVEERPDVIAVSVRSS